MSDYVLGFDIGGTMIKGGLFDRRGARVAADEVATQAQGGQGALVDGITRLAGMLQAGRGPACAVGIGIAGVIDAARTTLISSPNLPQLRQVPFKHMLEHALGVPVYLENDANVAALGELWAGEGRGCRNFMLVTLGTGVGSGLVLNGELWTGETGKAAEFGHMCVVAGGRACGCGRQGCIEAYASGSAVVCMVREALERGESSSQEPLWRAGPDALTPRLIYEQAVAGDRLCREVFVSAGRRLGIALAGVNNLLDIHVFILGGGVSRAAPVFGTALLESLRENVFAQSRDRVRIIYSKLGNAAGICGAAYLALQQLRPAEPSRGA